LKEEIASESSSSQAELHRFINETWPRSALEQPSVRYWRVAGRAVLLLLVAFSGLQYYFFDVHLTIMALPSITLLAGLP
jgi:hypothetical protein